jgi:hypothetical protein
MTDRVLMFANIIAWAMLVIGALRVIAVIHADVTELNSTARIPVNQRRTDFFWKSLLLAFFASAWLCAGRCA